MRLPIRVPATAGLAALTAAACFAAEPALEPGLYEVEVRIALPNVLNVAAPTIATRCLTAADLQSGQGFSVLSDNPLKNCPLLDYHATADSAVYRIVCPGPNMGHAVGVFELAPTTFRGTIKMNMGGKNMTMSETQRGRRTGDCP